MKIAVLGGGTAGYIAAVHMSHALPTAELFHIFDSTLPTIGVGEGTTPRFPMWLEEVTGVQFPELEQRCRSTIKHGTRLDGWGSTGATFLHRFQPTRLVGYHFNAAEVINVLADHVRATRVDARIESVTTSTKKATVRLVDGKEVVVDYVLDARGFPKAAMQPPRRGDGILRFDWVSTGRAILRPLPQPGIPGLSRAVARPFGWIFQIPLRDATGCGYIFNPRINTDAEVEADFTKFLESEGITTWTSRRALNFPNFACRQWFDGRVFRIGNAYSFVEPLEATAIGLTILQARSATRWIEDHGAKSSSNRLELARTNRAMLAYVCRDSLFVAWHYAGGSPWDTPFWRYARDGLSRARENPTARPHLRAMQEFIDAGESLPGAALSACDDQDQWDRDILPLLRVYRPFGNFSELNFAQVGHGIGYYATGNYASDRGAAASIGD